MPSSGADAGRVLAASCVCAVGGEGGMMNKSSERELKERLEDFMNTFAKYLSLPPYEHESPALAGTTHMLICHRKAKEALAASEQTDMEQFVKWLRYDWIMHLPTGDEKIDKTRGALMNDILEHIATEFGVGEDE